MSSTRLRHPVGVALLVALSAPVARATRCPNLMFILDRSGSMAADPQGGVTVPSKWQLAQQAIKATVDKYAYRLPLGLEMFTSLSLTDPGCYADTHIDVQPAHGTGMQILGTVMAATPADGTNTGEAIKRAYTDVPALQDPQRVQFIVLITDGDPNCNTGDLSGMATYTVSEIQHAASLNPPIHTFVIGFDGSGGVNPDNLNKMANAGGEPIPGCQGTQGSPCYYSAQNAQQFLNAVDMIVGQLIVGGVNGCDDSCFAVGNACAQGQACLFAGTEAACFPEGCFATPCPQGQVCGLIGQTPTCRPDQCAGVVCPSGQYCKQGVCTALCPTCAAGQVCTDGLCTPDFCANAQCAMGQVCDPSNGDCVENMCLGRMPICLPQLQCDPVTGQCADDPCRLLVCPSGAVCRRGSCEIAAPVDMAMAVAPVDAGPPVPDLSAALPSPTPTSRVPAGCQCAVGGRSRPAPLLVAGIAWLLLARRRRRAVVG
jgi:MYXO-CTERM domain-containing protein